MLRPIGTKTTVVNAKIQPNDYFEFCLRDPDP